jgi:hypothetical protein
MKNSFGELPICSVKISDVSIDGNCCDIAWRNGQIIVFLHNGGESASVHIAVIYL